MERRERKPELRRQRRKGQRADAEITAVCRVAGGEPAPVVVFDLSERDARLVAWTTLHADAGQVVELSVEGGFVWSAEVARVVAPGEYAVVFRDVPTNVRRLLVDTVHRHRAGRTGWADGADDFDDL